MVPNLICVTLSASGRQMGPINGGPINLASARLRRACLRFATLSGADLEAADLSDADLREVRLDGANLRGANLSQALLDGTDFSGARLAGAILNGTDLQRARNLNQEQIAECLGDAFTLLPPHLESPRSWTETEINLAEHQAMRPRDISQLAMRDRSAAVRVSWLVGGPASAA